jgi:hypothetical protein
MIQKSFTLFQIMSIDAMDLTPLLCVVRASKGSLFPLIGVLFFAIAVYSVVLLISSFHSVDLPIVPSFLMAPCLKTREVEPGLQKLLFIHRQPRADQPPFWASSSLYLPRF